MLEADVRVEAGPSAPISPFVFGGLIEHLGRTIYGGVWDQERDVARADVLAAIRAMGVSMLRWPGGCFSSWYHWRDGVGDKSSRPVHERQLWTDLAAMMGDEFAAKMGPRETNQFGTDEFLRYCLDVPSEPLLVANLGGGNPTGMGTPEEAAEWVRYCNVERRSPRPVTWWAVGNETWGAHELGHCSAQEYAKRFNEFADAMRREDPTIKLVAAGVSPDQYGLGAAGIWDGWNETLLGEAADAVDAVSLHWYFPGMIGRALRDDEADYLQVATGGDDLERVLAESAAELDRVCPGRTMPIALDEWGQMTSWEDHIEANHRLADAVFFAGCYNAMLRHADRLSMAMIAGLVNVLAPIQTSGDRMFVTAGYLVGMLYRQEARAGSVPVAVDSSTLAVPALTQLDAALMMPGMGRVDRQAAAVDASATVDAGGATVFLSNRSFDQPAQVTVWGVDGREARWRFVTGPDVFACNTVDHPDVLGYAERSVPTGSPIRLEIPPATTGALRVQA